MTGGVKVLAVDDCPAMRRLLEALFTAAGCQLVTATGARDALRILRAFQPDVVLTDYTMPRIDGHGLVTLLRRNPCFEATPIFVLSSEEDPDIRAAMRLAGADAWFSKPIEPGPLLGAVIRRPCSRALSPAGEDRQWSPPESSRSVAS
jgi:CheY-like chemotaxis protein